MFKNILSSLREKVRNRFYVMTLHAEEEMVNDNLTIFDVEHCILTGEITERQRDINSGEWKYRINGAGLDGGSICTIVKIGTSGKIVFITVFSNY